MDIFDVMLCHMSAFCDQYFRQIFFRFLVFLRSEMWKSPCIQVICQIKFQKPMDLIKDKG